MAEKKRSKQQKLTQYMSLAIIVVFTVSILVTFLK